MVDRFISAWSEITELSPCANCKHKSLGSATCDAFPAGIPEAIIWGKNGHTKPYQGDHGIRFERVDEDK